MNARVLLVAGVLLGVAGDLLLRMVPWGAGSAIWWAGFLGTTIYLGARRGSWVAAAAVATAAIGLVWRDSPPLVFLDVVLLLGTTGVFALGARGVNLFNTSLVRALGALVLSAAKAIAGFPQLVFTGIKWRRESGQPRNGALATSVRGILISLPLLLIFGALLTSADARFAQLIGNIFNFNIADVVGHIVVTAVLGAVCCGFLRSVTVPSDLPDFTSPLSFRLPAAELTIALGLLDALFATFIGVQARYFFGGQQTVLTSPDMTLASYARRGFFELVIVAALVAPLLLFTGSLISRRSQRAVRAFNVIAVTQVVLVLAIEASAFNRMQLYQREFGWTQDRLLTTAFMFWLVVLLMFLAVTILRSRFERFLGFATVTAIAAVFALHAFNPDDYIVRENVARARSGKRPLDAEYVRGLSADAVPALLASLDSFTPQQQFEFEKRWRARTVGRRPDWRTWNVSRQRARGLFLEIPVTSSPHPTTRR